jgi:hypothetical protein
MFLLPSLARLAPWMALNGVGNASLWLRLLTRLLHVAAASDDDHALQKRAAVAIAALFSGPTGRTGTKIAPLLCLAEQASPLEWNEMCAAVKAISGTTVGDQMTLRLASRHSPVPAQYQ